MTLCQQSDLIEVRRADNRGKGGRGVFALRDIPAGTLIERIPVLLIPKTQVFGEAGTPRSGVRISWYVFDWAGITKREYVALALGYGSIYNHSYTPNAKYTCIAPDIMEFESIKDIAAGEEIFINYSGDPNHRRDEDFEIH